MAAVLDAGALITVDRGDRARHIELYEMRRSGARFVTHPLVVAQVWRDGKGRQANLARFLKGVDIQPLDDEFGRRCGELVDKASCDDPIDAAVVLLARGGDTIVTSDPDDIQQLVAACERAVHVITI